MLEAKHDARLATLRDEFLRDAAQPTSAGSVEAALDKNGGWAAERHFRLGIQDGCRGFCCKIVLLTLESLLSIATGLHPSLGHEQPVLLAIEASRTACAYV